MDYHLGLLDWLLDEHQLANVLQQQVHSMGSAPHPSDVGVPGKKQKAMHVQKLICSRDDNEENSSSVDKT